MPPHFDRHALPWLFIPQRDTRIRDGFDRLRIDRQQHISFVKSHFFRCAVMLQRCDACFASLVVQHYAQHAGRRQKFFLAEQQVISNVRADLFPAVDHDRLGIVGSTFETFWNAGTIYHMAHAAENHQATLGIGAQIRGGAFCHAFVPNQLRLDEMIECVAA